MKNARIFSSFQLKIIAIIAMVIDHIGLFLYDKNGPISGQTYDILRGIGRVSFPIFCFLIVEGFYHTKNLNKYMLRIAVFAVISQIPYSLAMQDKAFSLFYLNIFFTLFVGLFCIRLFDYTINYYRNKKEAKPWVFMPVLLVIYLLIDNAGAIGLDYGSFGIVLMFMFYFIREVPEKYDDDKIRLLIFVLRFGVMFVAIDRLFYESEIYALFALIPITAYNGEKGRSMKWFFYVFYPVHLLVIYGVKRLIL